MKNVIFIPCPSQPDMKTAAETAAERLLEISVVPELYCGAAVYNGAPGNGIPGIILIFPDGCDEDARKAGREFSSQLCTEFCTVGQPSSLTIRSFTANSETGISVAQAITSWKIANDLYEGPKIPVAPCLFFQDQEKITALGILITPGTGAEEIWQEQVMASCLLSCFSEPEFSA